jgi:hypothetical protein
MARETSVAATVESTPPDTAQKAADAEEEVVEDGAALDGVMHFGMELQAVEPAFVVAHGGDRGVGGVGQDAEAGRQLLDAVPMAHPDAGGGGDAGEQGGVRGINVQLGMAVFPGGRRRDASAQGVGEGLHAVADAEHWPAGLEDVCRQGRSARLVYAGRPAGEDEAGRLQRQHALGRRVPGDQFAVNMGLAHPPGDELIILGAKVQHHDGFRVFRHPLISPVQDAVTSQSVTLL